MPASARSLGASLVTMLLRKSVDRGDLDHVDPPRSAFIGPNRCTADGARGVAARVDVRAPMGGHRAIGRCRHNQDTHHLVCTLPEVGRKTRRETIFLSPALPSLALTAERSRRYRSRVTPLAFGRRETCSAETARLSRRGSGAPDLVTLLDVCSSDRPLATCRLNDGCPDCAGIFRSLDDHP